MVAVTVPGSSGTPGAHTHVESDVTSLVADLATLTTAAAAKAAKASNLSDLASASSARTNLGLGGAAVLAVGTSSGTVAAGDDSRLTNARTPTAHATSHATGGSDPVTPAAIGAAPASYRLSPAEQHGYLGESFDLAAATSTLTPTSGTLYVARIYVPRAATITNLIAIITTGGSTLTSGQNFAALYDDAGTLLSATADQTTPWASTGVKAMALTAAQAIAADTFVRVALLAVATPTMPQFRAGTGSLTVNAGLTGAAVRWGTGATGQTTMPGTITPGSLAATGSFWVGLT